MHGGAAAGKGGRPALACVAVLQRMAAMPCVPARPLGCLRLRSLFARCCPRSPGVAGDLQLLLLPAGPFGPTKLLNPTTTKKEKEKKVEPESTARWALLQHALPPCSFSFSELPFLHLEQTQNRLILPPGPARPPLPFF